MEYQRDEHRVHLIMYHLIWCLKRLKSVLVGAVAKDCRALIEEALREHGWHLVRLEIKPDHVHLLVRAWPTTCAFEVIRACKGVTSRVLRKKHAHLRKIPSLWTRSYFASTTENMSAETVKRYIEAQRRA